MVRWLTYFGITREISKLHDVRSAKETRVVRWVFLFCFRDSIDFFVLSYGGREARAGELVAFDVLVCVEIYQHYH